MLKKLLVCGVSLFMLSVGVQTVQATVLREIRHGESLYKIAKNNDVTVTELKQANGLKGDRIYAGKKINIPTGDSNSVQRITGRDMELLARLIHAEAGGEPFKGKVAVASVVLNRMSDPKFPATVSGNIFKPHEFESVSNGLIWEQSPTKDAYKAAKVAFKGWDPTYGSKFFFNPAKIKGPSWIWTRKIVDRIGNHVFGV